MLTAAQYLNIIRKHKTNRLCEGKFDRRDRLTVEFDDFNKEFFYFLHTTAVVYKKAFKWLWKYLIANKLP